MYKAKIIAHIYICQDYFHGNNHRTKEEVAWLPLQKHVIVINWWMTI